MNFFEAYFVTAIVFGFIVTLVIFATGQDDELDEVAVLIGIFLFPITVAASIGRGLRAIYLQYRDRK
mgnify:CR=1 FL=1